MRVVVLTGAGVSAESGIPTFRGKDGLWNKYDPTELATPEAFSRDPKLVWEWYDWRRSLIAKAEPNEAHKTIAKMEEEFEDFWLITQNVDGLHQRAGSKRILELHGNIWKVRCTSCGKERFEYKTPLEELPPRCEDCNGLLRPGVVWFGEALPPEVLNKAIEVSSQADVFLVVGTSAVVYPAAELPLIAKRNGAKLIEVNPDDTPLSPYADVVIREKATVGVPKAFDLIRGKS